MIKPILFRGGMYGDLILGMLDPTALLETNNWQKEYKHSSCSGKYIKHTRAYLKKFFLYDDTQKHRYYKAFDSVKKPVYFLTHDTDFSQHYKDETTQLICSDLSLMDHFAERFERLHRPQVIQEAKSLIQNDKNFVDDYKKSLKLWQNAFVFPRRFDLKNIFDQDKFIHDLQQHYGDIDTEYARRVYDIHMQG